MNKEQIIDKVYERYSITAGMSTQTITLTREEFIHYIKTDVKFSETWGIKIEERELDMMERWKIADLTPNMEEFDFANYMCDKHNVPTKLITITYNNETIENYE